LDYPAGLVEIVVVSDGSMDATNDILQRYAQDSRVRVVATAESRGKAAGLNEAIAVAQGEIVVFTDARQKIEAGAIRLLTSQFADVSIGCASGELMLGAPASGEVLGGVGLARRLEKPRRESETAAGSDLGAARAVS